jgi:hypothetical protein
MDAFGRPNSGGKGKLFSMISLSILIYLKQNSFNSNYYYTFDILINLMVYLAEWKCCGTTQSKPSVLEQILIWSNVNFKGFPEECFHAPPPPLFTVDVSLYQNWTPSFRILAKSLGLRSKRQNSPYILYFQVVASLPTKACSWYKLFMV